MTAQTSAPQVELSRERLAEIIDLAWKKNGQVPFPLYLSELESIANDIFDALNTRPSHDSGGVEALKELANDVVGIQEDLPNEDDRNTLGYAAHYLRKFSIRSQASAGERGITDAMCRAAIDARGRDRIQGFSYKERGQHVIRDVWLPSDQQEIWTAPIAGPEEYNAFQLQCGIERTRKMLEAALSAATLEPGRGK